jgi:hypothetical protein
MLGCVEYRERGEEWHLLSNTISPSSGQLTISDRHGRRLPASFNCSTDPQSTELTRGPPELVQHFLFIGGVHIGARALHVLNFTCTVYGLAVSLSHPSGEEGDNFLVQNDFYLPSLA